MRVLRFFGGLLLALVAHLVLVAIEPRLAAYVDPFLLLIVFVALDGNVMGAVLAGCIAGLTQDAVSNGLFGVYGLAGTVVGFSLARVAQLLSLDRRRFVALLFAMAAVVQQIVALLLLVLLVGDHELPPLSTLAVRIPVAVAVGVVLMTLTSRLQWGWRSWRQQRQRPVRWEVHR